MSLAGSTNRNGAKVLISAMRSLKNGYDIGITPDGPKGPRHSVSGVLFTCKPTRFWKLNSWDGFVIPKPFGVLSFYASEPIDLKDYTLQEAKQIIYDGLQKHAS